MPIHYRWRDGSRKTGSILDDHYFGGFYQRRDGLALLKAHFTDSVGGDNRRNMLAKSRDLPEP
jgi:hypothetical protein